MKIYLSLNQSADNSDVINGAIDSAAQNDILVFPSGNFPILKTLVQNNKGLRWQSEECDTNLIFRSQNMGVRITRTQSTTRTFINGINFLGRFNGTVTGQHGIWASVPITIEDCIIENFHGDGIRLTADVNSSTAADVSFAFVKEVISRGNGGNGIFLQGGDANAGTFLHVDVRDNQGYGIWDASFLGNYFFGCMAHLNARGNYAATDVNNRSTFLGCYSEGGSPLSYFHGQAQIHGGLWDTGVILEHNAVAYIFNGDKSHYDLIRFNVQGQNSFRVFKRNSAPFEYQWRVYNQAGDTFVDKSYQSIQSADDCAQAAVNYINNINTIIAQ